MAVLDTTHKRKSAFITSIILLLLVFAIFNYGMKYFDPPIEYGVAINFGDSNVGSGDPIEEIQAPPQTDVIEEQLEEEVPEESTELVEEQVEEESSQEVVEEDLVTDNTVEEVPVVKKTDAPKEDKTPKKEDVKEIDKPDSKPKETVKPSKTESKKEVSKPKPSKTVTGLFDKLSKGNSQSGSNAKGEGDDSQEGVKGSKDGDSKSSKYYGAGGNGSGGNYHLSGRTALSKPAQKPNCEEEGVVVVTIYVNNSGRVTKAIPGAKGTTNSATCLFKAAKDAALLTKWNPDPDAPSTQRGKIIYNFSLSQ